MSKILVLGSSNTDMVVKTARFPQPGETIAGGEFFMFSGGKGANQAVAAARLGGFVTFICKVGNDIFGQQAVAGYRHEQIDTTYCLTDQKNATGVALITVNAEGENEIVVASGANASLSPTDIDYTIGAFDDAELLLMQLETPLDTIEYALHLASKRGIKTVLNPAPAQSISDHWFSQLFLITPNQTEAEILTGIKVTDLTSCEKAAQFLLDKGLKNVIFTLGSQGAFFKNGQLQLFVPSKKVKAVDTTAAGDVFNGALVVALAKGHDWQQAIEFANSAAAISVTRMGAQASAPYLKEL